jgi:glucose/arabinose dehydrogenase
MMLCVSSCRALILAAAAGTLLTAATATAQQPAPGAAPAAQTPPSGLVNPNATASSVFKDAPQNPAAQRLAPVAPLPLPTPGDKLPLAKLQAPKGFKIEVYASGMTNARSIRIGEKGTVFVSSRVSDKIYAITDKNGKREAKPLFTGLYRPNGIALHNGTLYIAELSQISKVDDIENHLDNPPKPQVIYNDLPKDEPHGWKFLTVGPDNRLYFNIGAPCNICMPPETNAQLRSINLDGSDPQVVARGIRQVVGMDWHPLTKKLYFTENQRDWLSEDIPQDKLNRLDHPGKDNFGFPYCHQGNIADPEFGWGHSCDEFTKPIALLGPHSAPLGMRFYTGRMFPAEYRNQIFIARHGSWNRTKKFGGDIVVATLDKNGDVKSIKPFITGFIQDNNYVGRPADLEVMKDGSLLVSDDYNGAVYRVTYAPHGSAHQVSESR